MTDYLTKKGFAVLVMIFLCMALISCSKQEDLSLIKNNTCTPPCWNGISPGSTNGEEVLITLVNLKTVKQETVKRATASHLLFKDVIFWDFIEANSGVIYLLDNRVALIDIRNTIYSLSNLIELYGEPDHVIFYPYNGKSWKVNVLYEKKGVWYYYTKNQAKNWMIDIQPTDQITLISFLDPSLLDPILSNSGSFFLKDENLKIEDVKQAWNGYGEMRIILGK